MRSMRCEGREPRGLSAEPSPLGSLPLALCARPGMTALTEDVLIEIEPLRIALFVQFDFPGPVPAFDLPLAVDGVADVVMFFEPDQQMHTVFLRESLDQIALVL